MHETLAVATAFPTVAFTVLLALAVLYWLFVVIGAVDLDGFDGAAKGALEGATKGALEGATKGVLGGADGGVGDVDGLVADNADGHGDANSPGFIAGIIEALKLRSVPATVTLSFFSLFGWLLSGLAALSFGPFAIPLGAGVFALASVASLLVTSLAIRPLAPAFKVKPAPTQLGLEGRIAVVSTGEVTTSFGQATLDDGGAGLILQIRTDGQTKLQRGDRVVLLSCNTQDGSFLVEKLPSHDDVLLYADSSEARVGPAAAAESGSVADDASEDGADRTSGVRRTSR